MKIVIIIPTYNERANISKLIPLLEKEIFPRIKNHEMHILVVDDKSPDGTADEVAVCMQEWKNIQLLSGDKNGLGAAYVRGMKYAMEKMQADVNFLIFSSMTWMDEENHEILFHYNLFFVD